MAYSIQQFTSTGVEDHVILSFPYLDKTDIHVYGDSVETAFVWASETRIDFPPFPAGTEVVVRRLTQRDRVRYLLQEGAPFTREVLDQIHTQALYLAQESIEGAWFDIYGDVDMHGFRIRNAGNPELPNDYTTKLWVEGQIIAAQLGDGALADELTAQVYEALRRSYYGVGIILVGTFKGGCTVPDSNAGVLDTTTGVVYTWGGHIPMGGVVVPPVSTPDTTGGIGPSAWVNQALKTPVVSPLRNVQDYGADPSGALDSTAAFVAAGFFGFVPDGLYLVDPAQVQPQNYWGAGKLKYSTDGSEHWCGLVSKGPLYIRNDDRNTDGTPKVPADGLINLADGELMFLCDLDGDGDYDADMYGKNNLYIAASNSIHFRIAPQTAGEGRIRLAATTNTNFIQSGKDFSGSTLKNLAFGPYLSTSYWLFISHVSGFVAIGDTASPAAPLHVYNSETTPILAENTGAARSRIGCKGSTTSTGTTVTFGANGNDAEVRAGGTERLVITADGFVRPASPATQNCGSNPFPWAGGFTQAAFTVTSDERLKTPIKPITDDVLRAWLDVDWGQYQFLDRIATKGDKVARTHFGVGAQRVLAVFKAHGLDATEYAFFCHDSWDAVIDPDTKEVITPAGERYGIRYEEALVLEAAALRMLIKDMQRKYN